MRILVTGGAGFIGSHLCERLLREGHELTILDDLNSFYSPQLKQDNLAEVRRRGAVRFVEADICDEAAVAGVFQDERFEAVVHLAARAGVRPSLEDPLLYERVNVRGTLVLLEQARRGSVEKFVFASSSSVYGATNAVPFSEADNLLLPLSPYAATKLAGEKLCYTYSHLYGLPVVCLRFFTVYGPRQRPDLAIRKFSEAILAGRPIPFFGDGTSARDYTFVSDTVSGIVAALGYATRYDIFNLGNSSPVTLADLVQAIEEALGRKAVLNRLPDQPGDVPITFADNSRAGRELGYRPRTSLKEGLRQTADWVQRTCAAAGQA
ncbi:MAG: GDP-mannose 4,6-dehydratase [Acidobacteria bacterium]|nr:GDP-mannose 4,6-dehydratase [Acidobacteriota bacterium]